MLPGARIIAPPSHAPAGMRGRVCSGLTSVPGDLVLHRARLRWHFWHTSAGQVYVALTLCFSQSKGAFPLQVFLSLLPGPKHRGQEARPLSCCTVAGGTTHRQLCDLCLLEPCSRGTGQHAHH